MLFKRNEFLLLTIRHILFNNAKFYYNQFVDFVQKNTIYSIYFNKLELNFMYNDD